MQVIGLRSRVRPLAIAAAATIAVGGCSLTSSQHVVFRIANPVALADATSPIVITGLDAREQVTIRARTVDADNKVLVSAATFRANASGVVDLTKDAPLRGSYTGVQPMGLIWSMMPPHRTTQDYGDALPVAGEVVHLTAIEGGDVVAHADLTRLSRALGVTVTTLSLKEDGVFGRIYEPPGITTPRPGILIFGGSEGGLSVLPEARLLASHGYPTLGLAYFHEPGLPRYLVDIPLEYFAKALRILAKTPGVDPRRMVVYGISRGSEAAQLLGVDYPDLVAAVVALVPSKAALAEYAPGAAPPILRGAWTYRSREVPFSGFVDSTDDLSPALIQDERIRGPLFLDCGGFDATWPSCPMAKAIVARLARFHRPAPVLLDYPNAGHGIGDLVPDIPLDYAKLDGADFQANFVARLDGWPRLLAFIAAVPRIPV